MELQPDLVNKRNNHNQTIFHMISDRHQLVKFIIDKYQHHFYPNLLDVVDDNNNTLLTNSISSTSSTSSTSQVKYNIEYLLKHDINLNIPRAKPPIILATILENFELMVKNVDELILTFTV